MIPSLPGGGGGGGTRALLAPGQHQKLHFCGCPAHFALSSLGQRVPEGLTRLHGQQGALLTLLFLLFLTSGLAGLSIGALLALLALPEKNSLDPDVPLGILCATSGGGFCPADPEEGSGGSDCPGFG